MTADEFRATLRDLGMSQTELRLRLGLNKSTVNRWAQNQLDVPQYAVAYLESEKKIRAAHFPVDA